MYNEFCKKLPTFHYENIDYKCWYDDDKYSICFSSIPDIRNKEINKFVMSKEEIKKAKKKPLYCENEIKVLLQDKKKHEVYTFVIPQNYDYDGASIHKFFARIIGSKEDIRFKIASLVHDVLCENHHYVNNDRYFANKIFERLLFVADVPALLRWSMFHSVDNFQKFCNWRS